MLESAIKISFDLIPLALTPIQRLNAAGRFDVNLSTERIYIIIGIVTLLLLVTAFFVLSLKKTKRVNTVSGHLFDEYAEKAGLSDHERNVLKKVAGQAGLEHNDDIFTMDKAFDFGTSKMVDEKLVSLGDDKSKKIRTELSAIRDKLGFHHSNQIRSIMENKHLSSRRIPVGKLLNMVRQNSNDTETIEASVIVNNDTELHLKLSAPIKIVLGETWCLRYYFGASVWEFDSSVISCIGKIIVLNHNDNIRFINRRKFPRVEVRRMAFVAKFPFAKTIEIDESAFNSIFNDQQSGHNISQSISETLKPPEFYSAMVTELGGPGLKVDVPFSVSIGDRIIVVFVLDEADKGKISTENTSSGKKTIKIIEDVGVVEQIAEVRRAQNSQEESSIAVELIGLRDSDIDELICATNAASLKSNHTKNEISEDIKV